MISLGMEIWIHYCGFTNYVSEKVVDYWWGKCEPIEDEL